VSVPVLFSEDCPPGTAFLIPQVQATVFYPNTQPAPTWEQELEAILNAYLAAAKAGQVGIIQTGEKQ
jgi:hypothetical protein